MSERHCHQCGALFEGSVLDKPATCPSCIERMNNWHVSVSLNLKASWNAAEQFRNAVGCRLWALGGDLRASIAEEPLSHERP
jgi:hypothetical protein